MEHRWYPRRKVARRALLCYSGEPGGRCLIEDVSPDGMYIRIRRGDLDNGSCVDVVFDGTPWGASEPVRSRAVVVHRQEDGFGLMCLGVNPIYALVARGSKFPRSAPAQTI